MEYSTDKNNRLRFNGNEIKNGNELLTEEDEEKQLLK